MARKVPYGSPRRKDRGAPQQRNLPAVTAVVHRGQATVAALKLGAMTHGKSTERERRAERLAAALKENLRRRKAQARGRAAEDATETTRIEANKAPERDGEG